MDIKIIVATHKKYWMPVDNMYLPVHVGAVGCHQAGRAYSGHRVQRGAQERDRRSAENSNIRGLYSADFTYARYEAPV